MNYTLINQAEEAIHDLVAGQSHSADTRDGEYALALVALSALIQWREARRKRDAADALD